MNARKQSKQPQGERRTLSCGCVVIDYDEDSGSPVARKVVRACRRCREDYGFDWDRARDERDGY